MNNSAQTARAGEAAPGPDAPCAGRLLIVDDLADNRAVLTRRFVRRGFEIVEAASGEEALRLLREKPFDVVLLDVMMPGMDGTQVLARIRQQFSALQLPVIMVTAKSQAEDVVEALKLGANDYVTKPVDFSVALARVTNQIDLRRSDLELRKNNETLQQRVSERSRMLLRAKAAIQEEMTRRIASEDKIAYLARHDTLTGLPNRFTFDERLSQSRKLARDCGSQLALLFVDLDGFKNVNDTLGHAIGDELLKAVAERFASAIGVKDFCARLGGDEFAIVHMSEDARSTAAVLAEKVISAVSGCHMIGGYQVYIGASVGISVLYGGDNDAETLLKEADLAMYRAKADGRGVYRFFEAEMAERAERQRNLEIDLRHAIASGNFELYYQPVLDLKAARVTGVEALMRWNHPIRGFVPPVEFIELAEDTGLIVPMGEWALRHACADAARWSNPLRVAINVSSVQFRNPGLVTVVMNALGASGLPPERLELEVTESVLLGPNPQNIATLKQLRQLGIRLSLDDFGTGRTGLGYFREFQFDKVKIDRSFVQEMIAQPESRAIVRAAIGLGENMGISATAEGVETVEQLECLLSEGCTEFQGFLFSAPRPNADILKAIDEIADALRAQGRPTATLPADAG
ncbi:MAG: EAL domain-containing protein [Hyphomicrobiales bacterium]|nr:EAL domain-containing protein [Hyphomicrobiales bacterium]